MAATAGVSEQKKVALVILYNVHVGIRSLPLVSELSIATTNTRTWQLDAPDSPGPLTSAHRRYKLTNNISDNVKRAYYLVREYCHPYSNYSTSYFLCPRSLARHNVTAGIAAAMEANPTTSKPLNWANSSISAIKWKATRECFSLAAIVHAVSLNME